MKSLLQKANHCHASAYFARVNWSACFVGLATSVVAECAKELRDLGFSEPYVSVLGHDARKGIYDHQKSEIWGDSISVNLGQRPIPVRAVVPVKGRMSVLSESRASLVFSQSVSGSVIAMIYPPSSEVAKPRKACYMVDLWMNPSDVTKKQIKKIFRLFVETDLFCGAAVYPNSAGSKILAKLEAKDAVLENGGSRIWVWFKYAFRITGGVLRLYGIGKPTPP
jgi:hypothetical protein